MKPRSVSLKDPLPAAMTVPAERVMDFGFVALRDANAISALSVSSATETGRWSVLGARRALRRRSAMSSSRRWSGRGSRYAVQRALPASMLGGER